MKNVTDVARESAYVVVGLGVLGLQQVQTRRKELEARLRSIDPSIDAQITRVHEEVGRRLQDAEAVVARAEDQLPGPIGETLRTLRTQISELVPR